MTPFGVGIGCPLSFPTIRLNDTLATQTLELLFDFDFVFMFAFIMSFGYFDFLLVSTSKKPRSKNKRLDGGVVKEFKNASRK